MHASKLTWKKYFGLRVSAAPPYYSMKALKKSAIKRNLFIKLKT